MFTNSTEFQEFKTNFQQTKNELEKLNLKVSLSTAAASFLVMGALIVIGCSLCCLALPGINVITQILVPAILPSICAIAIAVPLIIYNVKVYKEHKNLKIDLVSHYCTLFLHEETKAIFEKKDYKKSADLLIRTEMFKKEPGYPTLVTKITKSLEKLNIDPDYKKTIEKTLEEVSNKLYDKKKNAVTKT